MSIEMSTTGPVCSERLHYFPVPPHLLLGESSTLDELFLSDWSSGEKQIVAINNNEETKLTSMQIPTVEIGVSKLATTGPSCYQVSLTSVVMISVICGLVIAYHQCIKDLLLWLKSADLFVGYFIFMALFIAVSFPVAWGYILLMLAAGYLYGIIFGPIVVITCGVFGMFIAHMTIKHCCKNCIMRKFYNEKMDAVIRVVESDQGFKLVALARLTPIPFGLQNGLFAMTNISGLVYTLASLCGLVPTAILNCYVGSTLRSMEDVLSEETDQAMGYIIFITQIIITCLLLWFVVRKARAELKKTVENNGQTSVYASSEKDKIDV